MLFGSLAQQQYNTRRDDFHLLQGPDYELWSVSSIRSGVGLHEMLDHVHTHI